MLEPTTATSNVRRAFLLGAGWRSVTPEAYAIGSRRARELEHAARGTQLAPRETMMPSTTKPQAVEPELLTPADHVDFAEEAGPKDTEFKNEKDAKALTSGGFDLIP
jgi:hypothetical protein